MCAQANNLRNILFFFSKKVLTPLIDQKRLTANFGILSAQKEV